MAGETLRRYHHFYFLPNQLNFGADHRGWEQVKLFAVSLVLILVIVALQLLMSPTTTRPTKQVFHPSTRREAWRRTRS